MKAREKKGKKKRKSWEMLGDRDLMKIKGRSLEEKDPRAGGGREGEVLGVMLSIYCHIVCL